MTHSANNHSIHTYTQQTAAPLQQLALVDIGSNSIRTMTARMECNHLIVSEKEVFTTRLAEGLLQTGRLSDARMEQSLAVIRTFADRMHAQGVFVFAYATSAVRDAANRDRFVSAVGDCIGGRIAVLSGEEEARYAFSAATGGIGGMLDIGGGSTQAVTARVAHSFALGCVRAHDLCPNGSLEEIRRAVDARLDEIVDVDDVSTDCWTGVGGSITTLAALLSGCTAYDREQVSAAVLTPKALTALLEELAALGDARRAAMPLLKKRHDVILHGGAILLYFMNRLAIGTMRISDADGLEGYAAHLFALANLN